jgi:LmbE family N-acetylglucosaminyl deacetylase
MDNDNTRRQEWQGELKFLELWYKWAVNWIYFSPHLDDVALSCGGLLWEQAVQGAAVSVWTICAGEAPGGELSPFASSLHARWGSGPEAVALRRLEDAASCREMNASYRHLTIPDCIYRRGGASAHWLYDSESALFGSLHTEDSRLADALSAELGAILPTPAILVCPLALGGHVDHRLTRSAVERLLEKPGKAAHWQLWYYADFPYVVRESIYQVEMPAEGWEAAKHAISQDGLAAWSKAVAAHRSQISTFWSDVADMQADLQEYVRGLDGVRLWRPIKNGRVF